VRIALCTSFVALFVLACSARPQLMLGNDCEFTTQCPAPLVCRLGHCRDECRDNRDCRLGLVCLRDENGLGACELPVQDRCVLTSDCDMPLVCVMGRCSEACLTDVDCPAGAECVADGMGGTGCRDMSTMTECMLNSDCTAPLICAPDHRCHEQCHTDRDCRDGLVCDTTMMPTVCAPPHDAGPPSDGGADAGTDTGLDAAMVDTGVDGGMAVMTGPSPIPLLVAGEEDVCATLAGQLRCWGAGTSGQIGDNGFVDRHVTTPLSLTNVTMLASGSLHTCAYSTTSGLRCWGDGASGQIGDGLMMPRGAPTTVNGALTPTWIAGGASHTCAVSAGNVLCWGSNASGEIGDGSITPRPSPTPTMPLAGTAVEVAARGSATCARLMDGRVQCWGDDRGGQLGVNLTSPMYSTTPLIVSGVSNAVEVVLGSRHACARRVDGVVLCWGNDSQGQLGDSATGGARLVPAPTSAMPPAVELAAAGDHTCARTIDGNVYCWGDNFLGQCGRDPLISPTAGTLRFPQIVPGVSNATELTTGDNHTCARVAAGFVCWGDNTRGQLGDGTINSHFAPMPVGWP
jgi:alpha-tubulin suppressor-like RCC1 family protein